MTKKAYIVGGTLGGAYARLFRDYGLILTSEPKDADLLVFTGGEDVSPVMYGHGIHSSTHFNPTRDAFESVVFREHKDKPKVGICRGGQFLNVKSGGKMFQDVNNHTRPHPIFKPDGGPAICIATSTHHQMMIPGRGAEVLAIANQSTYRDMVTHDGIVVTERGAHDDTEVVYYDETKALCFQPHPELGYASDDLKSYFFQLLKEKLGVKS